MAKRLVCEKVETAQDLLAEALATRRKLKPGMIIRYFFHDFIIPGNHHSEVDTFTGVDRIELLRQKEPRVFLQRLQRWVFGRDCLILPRDSVYADRVRKLDQKIADDIHKKTGKRPAND